MILRVSVGLAFVLLSIPAAAQDADGSADVQVRLAAQFKKKITKQWDAWVTPEVRTDNLAPDRGLLELGAGYDPFEYLAFKAMIRGDVNASGEGLGAGMRTGLSAKGKLSLGDFEPGLRLYYTYDFGEYRDEEHRLRYQASVKYNVPGVRLDVALALEAFHRLNDNWLFKLRYGVELEYKFYKSKKLDQFVYAGYALDQFFDRPTVTHIPALGYKLSF